jgi:hypothetical protein
LDYVGNKLPLGVVEAPRPRVLFVLGSSSDLILNWFLTIFTKESRPQCSGFLEIFKGPIDFLQQPAKNPQFIWGFFDFLKP